MSYTSKRPLAGQSKKARPSQRITFARIIGQDEEGNDVLGPAREIGAVWPRKNGKKGGILKLDHFPAELAQHQGVLFVLPVDGPTEERS